MASKTHLIILPCHSIWKKNEQNKGDAENEWFLEPFQVEGKDYLCFKDHIVTSLNVLSQNPEASLLVISGGQTKKQAGPISEALSYFQLATNLNEDKDLLKNVKLEEFARDSFENVLFSLCRFYEVAARYPTKITIVGFEFKRQRFLNNHLKSLKFPLDQVTYIGNSPHVQHLSPSEQTSYFNELKENEYKYAVKFFDEDAYGVRSPLYDKKAKRNPFNRVHGYLETNDELRAVLELSQAAPENNVTQTGVTLSKMPWGESLNTT